jgi:hypothetical protein
MTNRGWQRPIGKERIRETKYGQLPQPPKNWGGSKTEKSEALNSFERRVAHNQSVCLKM